ncbi:MAG: hypothetical protein GQ574_27560 [Crocinitomix sp.]|nr:hypothetical protein [Crocinitomix sp.]
MKTLLFSLFVFFLSTFSNQAAAQINFADSSNTEQLYVIKRHDGVEYIGKILIDNARELLIETENLGQIYLPKSEIKSITRIINKKDIINGEYQQDGPFTTRYTFTTNALPIKKGENYAMINLYGPEVHFAMSDKFSLGVMSSWIVSPMLLAGKYTINTKNEKINFSLGTLMGTSGYLNNFRGYGGLHFANVTFGSRMNNVTLAGGYAYLQPGSKNRLDAEGTYYSEDQYFYSYERITSPLIKGPIFSIAGITKVGARASFVFDSMIGVFSQTDSKRTSTAITPTVENDFNSYQHVVTHYENKTTALFVMPGMRFQSTERRAFQVSLAGVSVFGWASNEGGSYNFSFPIPMCSWFFKF